MTIAAHKTGINDLATRAAGRFLPYDALIVRMTASAILLCGCSGTWTVRVSGIAGIRNGDCIARFRGLVVTRLSDGRRDSCCTRFQEADISRAARFRNRGITGDIGDPASRIRVQAIPCTLPSYTGQ